MAEYRTYSVTKSGEDAFEQSSFAYEKLPKGERLEHDILAKLNYESLGNEDLFYDFSTANKGYSLRGITAALNRLEKKGYVIEADKWLKDKK